MSLFAASLFSIYFEDSELSLPSSSLLSLSTGVLPLPPFLTIPVTTEYALLLEAALGTNASIWIGLQADYNMQKAKQDKSFMKRLEKIRKIAAIL